MAEYVVRVGSDFGLAKSRAWLLQLAMSFAIYYVVMKPMVVAVYYVVIPEIVQNKARRSLHIYGPGERTPHVPFATRLPRNYLYYVLHMAPELRTTRAARVLLRSEGSHRHVSADAFVDALAAAETGGRTAGRETRANFFKGASLGRVPFVSAHFWTSDHLSERPRRMDACSGTCGSDLESRGSRPGGPSATT